MYPGRSSIPTLQESPLFTVKEKVRVPDTGDTTLDISMPEGVMQ